MVRKRLESRGRIELLLGLAQEAWRTGPEGDLLVGVLLLDLELDLFLTLLMGLFELSHF